MRLDQLRFTDITSPEDIEILPAGGKYMRVVKYGFHYHSGTLTSVPIDQNEMRIKQANRLNFLGRALFEDVAFGEKIFVRKSKSEHNDEMFNVFEALQAVNSMCTLLWVTLADEAHPSGSVEIICDNLLRGHVDRFAPYDRAPDLSLHSWIAVCKRAYAFKNAGTTEVVEQFVPSLLPDDPFATLLGSSNATSQFDWNLPRLRPNHGVLLHKLVQNTHFGNSLAFGMHVNEIEAKDGIYTLSLWVWLSDNFSGTVVGAVFDGYESLKSVLADHTLRNQWQRTWVSTRVPSGRTMLHPGLSVVGDAGCQVYSTCWRVEKTVVPSELL